MSERNPYYLINKHVHLPSPKKNEKEILKKWVWHSFMLTCYLNWATVTQPFSFLSISPSCRFDKNSSLTLPLSFFSVSSLSLHVVALVPSRSPTAHGPWPFTPRVINASTTKEKPFSFLKAQMKKKQKCKEREVLEGFVISWHVSPSSGWVTTVSFRDGSYIHAPKPRTVRVSDKVGRMITSNFIGHVANGDRWLTSVGSHLDNSKTRTTVLIPAPTPLYK